MTDADGSPFAPRRDDFDEWFRTPVASTSPDPRIEVRRAEPSEFDRVYDLVDEAFGFKRPRALNEWVYRHNPHGLARCWVTVERATRQLVGASTNWPWPMARGMSPVSGSQGGDNVLLPNHRHLGLAENARRIRESHPWTRSIISYGWPNPNAARRIGKRPDAARLIGVLPSRVFPLQARPYLARRGLPQPVAAIAGRMLDSLFASWSDLVLRRPFNGHIEPIRRFDAAFDEVTRRCMAWKGYWSPHDSDFLNWRYLRDPIREHLGFALTVGSTLTAYSVVRLGSERAHLMEFVVPPEQPGAARMLLLHTIKATAAAGCSQLAVTAPPGWRHWQLLRSAGFVNSASTLLMYVYSWRDDMPGVQTLENWQMLGGDFDPFYD